MLTDSHCHLASHRFEESEVPALIQRAQAAGVGRLVTLATSLGDLHTNLAIAENPTVHACIGIHPCDVHHAPDDAVDQLAAFTGDPRVCAIGETGLDYYHPAPDGWTEHDFRERQRAFLRRHFEIAAASGLNVVIHTRDQSAHASFEDALEIYRDFHTKARAVFHCFIGPWENAKHVLDLGGLVSFGGVATFKSAREVRDTALKCPAGSFMVETDAPYLAPEPHRGKRNEPAYVRDTALKCPAGSFMVETDAPYLAPEPHRGKRNEPAYVRDTAMFLATLRGESFDELSAHTGRTAAAFFHFRSAGN